MGMKKCALVCNPNSGHNKKKPIIEKMIDVLKDYDYETEVIRSILVMQRRLS